MASDFLAKPFQSEELLARVETQVSLARMHRESRVLAEKLQILVDTDPLTGIGNRRSFISKLRAEFGRSLRLGHQCALIMIDVDHFKSVNDRFGHPVGDDVLQCVSGVLARGAREYDTVGRIGEGEVSAWELGSGSMRISTLLGMMNLVALSTGLFLEPKRMWAAFALGCSSQNLYPAAIRARIDNEHWASLPELQQAMLPEPPQQTPSPLKSVEFLVYACSALLIHAAIAIPAVITRIVTELTLGKSFIEAIKPVKRRDLF